MDETTKAKKFVKMFRKESNRLYQQFKDSFDINDYVKPCPKFIPKFIWNFLIWLVLKHK